MVDLVAPTVEQLYQQLMPWLSISVDDYAVYDSSHVDSAGSFICSCPEHSSHPMHDRPDDVPSPKFINRNDIDMDLLLDSDHFVFNVNTTHLSYCDFEFGDNYLFIPDDSFIIAPTLFTLEFYDSDSLLFSFTLLTTSVTAVLPPPTSDSPPRWDGGQILGLVSDFGDVRFNEE